MDSSRTSDPSDDQRQAIAPGDQPAIRVLAMPEAANAYGDIFGGWIVAHADLAGGVRALECARGRVATVAINHFRFHEPVFVGDLVSFYARVRRVGNTSITVDVEVFARRHPSHQESVKVTEGVLTYVAVDDSGKPRRVPRE